MAGRRILWNSLCFVCHSVDFSIGILVLCILMFSRLIEFLMCYKNFPFFIVRHFLFAPLWVAMPCLQITRFPYKCYKTVSANNCSNVKYFCTNTQHIKCFAVVSVARICFYSVPFPFGIYQIMRFFKSLLTSIEWKKYALALEFVQWTNKKHSNQTMFSSLFFMCNVKHGSVVFVRIKTLPNPNNVT